MKYSAPTIKDIARALNLSTSTVSRALRDSYEINPATKKLVLEYAARLNYHPNPIALSLRERRSLSLGVVVCEVANSFFSQVINGVESIAYEKGYQVIISQSRESSEKEWRGLQYLASRSVDGLLISLSTETTDLSLIRQLHVQGLPIVFFDRVAEDIPTHKVTVDGFQAAYKAVTHLVENGFRRIAIVANAAFLSITKERVAGYEKALRDHGLPVRESYIRYCEHGGMYYDEVDTAVRSLLAERPKPDAIFAASDKLTTNTLRILRLLRIRIPDQMALAGFSNSELTELIDPPLTVIKQPAFEMGLIATELLLQLIETKRPVKEFEIRKLQAEVWVRASTQPRKKRVSQQDLGLPQLPQ
jgi:DNA-binding LacI/PurR family transcriptional regulator